MSLSSQHAPRRPACPRSCPDRTWPKYPTRRLHGFVKGKFCVASDRACGAIGEITVWRVCEFAQVMNPNLNPHPRIQIQSYVFTVTTISCFILVSIVVPYLSVLVLPSPRSDSFWVQHHRAASGKVAFVQPALSVLHDNTHDVVPSPAKMRSTIALELVGAVLCRPEGSRLAFLEDRLTAMKCSVTRIRGLCATLRNRTYFGNVPGLKALVREFEALFDDQTWEQEVFRVVEAQVKEMKAWKPQPKILACEAEEDVGASMSTNAMTCMHPAIHIQPWKKHRDSVSEHTKHTHVLSLTHFMSTIYPPLSQAKESSRERISLALSSQLPPLKNGSWATFPVFTASTIRSPRVHRAFRRSWECLWLPRTWWHGYTGFPPL